MKNKKLRIFQMICGSFMLLSLVSLMWWQNSLSEMYVFLVAPFFLLLEISRAAFEIGEPMVGFAAGALECGLWLLLIAAVGAAAKGKRLGRNAVYGILGVFIAVDLIFVKVFRVAMLVGLMILLNQIWKDREE